MHSLPVEICIESSGIVQVTEAVRAALEGGAARIELCSAMDEDGLTPPATHIREAQRVFGARSGLVVMIRPRPGNFVYTSEEVATIHRQIRAAADAGASGVALGVLRNDRTIDLDALHGLVRTAHAAGLHLTFHRAFDALANPNEAIDELVETGVDRVLTSGTPWGMAGTLLDGLDNLASTILKADSRLEVVLAGGVNAANLGMALARLPLEGRPVSVHAYSGAREKGRTTGAAVRQLVETATIQ